MPRLYVSQSLADVWVEHGGARVDGDLLRISPSAGDGVSWTLFLNPAVVFERIDGHAADPYGLVGAVKSTQELAQMGAEYFDVSVVLAEHAYTVRPGFLAVPITADGEETQFDARGWQRLVDVIAHLSGRAA
jgi:hypothetical protein